MKTLSIQIQTDLLLDAELADAVASLLQLTRPPPDVQEAVDEGVRYMNVNFLTPDAPQLWKTIESKISQPSDPLSSVAKGIIVVCEGEHGWSDYLLLHHFDKQKTVDTFENGDKGPGSKR